MGFIDRSKHWYYLYRQYVPASVLYHRHHFTVLHLSRHDGAALHACRDACLRHVLSVACTHVAWYRATVRLSAAALANEPPLALLHEFPLLTKSEVAVRQNEFLHERLDPRFLNYVTTGGSTGEGIGMWRSKRLADIEKAFLLHEWGRFGFSFHRSAYLRMGADARRPAGEPPFRRVGNVLLLSPYHIAPRHKGAIVDMLNRERPRFVHAYPSAAAALADLLAPGDIDFPVHAVFLVSEPATRPQFDAIAGLFRCPISISYGQSERVNLAFARYHEGELTAYRFDPLYGVTETLPHRDGREEIVGTSLWNDVMPLIRYRTGDFGSVDAQGICPAIDGREGEFLIDRHGNRIPGLSVMPDPGSWQFVRLYQIRQEAPGMIRLVVVGKHGRLSAEQKACLLAEQHRRLAGFFDLELVEVPDIPLAANGKRKLVDTSGRVVSPA
jgi:phenylacetate-CoA ligase